MSARFFRRLAAVLVLVFAVIGVAVSVLAIRDRFAGPPPPVSLPVPVLPTFAPQAPTADTLAKLKAAAVFLEIEDARGVRTSGSGWLGVEPNWIVTNAHVVGMLKPGSPPPAKITAFVNPGVTGKQLELPHAKLRVLAVDRDMDLALLEALNPSAPLPDPLPVRPSAGLVELERLVVVGFPGGRRVAEKNRRSDAPAVTVSASAVGGLRRDSFDNLFAVQVQGGILHGSSGGPVCDLDGYCVGVAVRVDLDHADRLTGVGYAVPTEYVTGLVAGRAASVTAGQQYATGNTVTVPVTVHCHDPRKKLAAVGVIAWVGDAAAPPRPPGVVRPPAAPADSADIEVSLKYDPAAGTAFGEVPFPPLPEGRAYWVQPWYSNERVPKQFLAAVKLDAGGPPVTRKAIDLAAKFPAEAKQSVSLKRVVELTDADAGESAGWPTALKYEVEFAVAETLAKQGKNTSRTFAMESLVTRRTRNGWAEAASPQLVEFIRNGVGGATATLTQDEYGTATAMGWASNVPAFAGFAAPLASGLQSAAVPVQNKRIEPLASWVVTRDGKWSLPTEGFDVGPPLAPPVPESAIREAVMFTYLGLRDRGGKPEAVVGFTGTVSPLAGAAVAVSGSVWGEATLDPDTGEVMTATVRRAFELGFGRNDKRTWSGSEEWTLRRQP